MLPSSRRAVTSTRCTFSGRTFISARSCVYSGRKVSKGCFMCSPFSLRVPRHTAGRSRVPARPSSSKLLRIAREVERSTGVGRHTQPNVKPVLNTGRQAGSDAGQCKWDVLLRDSRVKGHGIRNEAGAGEGRAVRRRGAGAKGAYEGAALGGGVVVKVAQDRKANSRAETGSDLAGRADPHHHLRE